MLFYFSRYSLQIVSSVTLQIPKTLHQSFHTQKTIKNKTIEKVTDCPSSFYFASSHCLDDEIVEITLMKLLNCFANEKIIKMSKLFSALFSQIDKIYKPKIIFKIECDICFHHQSHYFWHC